MWQFQGHRVTQTPGSTPRDSFARAIEDLDNIPLTYNPSRRDRLSGQFDDTDRFPSLHDVNTQSGHKHTITWGSEDTMSTLKVADDQASSIDDLEAERPKPPAGPPPAVGFWDPGLRETRWTVLKKYSWTLSILCLFVLGVLSIYWGVLFRVKENLHHATIAVVDFDGRISPYQDVVPLIGPAVVSATEVEKRSKPDALGYQIHDPAQYDYDHLKVRRAVHEEKLWGAIIINANATALLRHAVEVGNSSYDPLGACQIVYNQARDIESYNQYISPVLVRLASDITASFGHHWTASVLANDTIRNYTLSPQALSPAIGFSIFNLRPFDPPVAIPAVSIGLIYLIIIAFFSFGFFLPTHMLFVVPNPKSPHPPLKFVQLIIYRYLATVTAYLCLSFFYSMVSLVFLIPMNNSPPKPLYAYAAEEVYNNANPLGHATFVVYWMLNFMGMAALGLACENVAMLIGTPWTALWLIFWVITNVSTGFYALELAPPFYRWGYVWPLRQIVYASRTILFGTRNNLSYNFGILVLWIGVSTLLFPVMCWFLRWKTIRAKRKAAGERIPPVFDAPKIVRDLRRRKSGSGRGREESTQSAQGMLPRRPVPRRPVLGTRMSTGIERLREDREPSL